jgi:hypothetical protein
MLGQAKRPPFHLPSPSSRKPCLSTLRVRCSSPPAGAPPIPSASTRLSSGARTQVGPRRALPTALLDLASPSHRSSTRGAAGAASAPHPVCWSRSVVHGGGASPRFGRPLLYPQPSPRRGKGRGETRCTPTSSGRRAGLLSSMTVSFELTSPSRRAARRPIQHHVHWPASPCSRRNGWRGPPRSSWSRSAPRPSTRSSPDANRRPRAAGIEPRQSTRSGPSRPV